MKYCPLFILILISCSKDLNQVPISSTSVNLFFKNQADFEQAVNASYSLLRGVVPTGGGYPDRLLNLSEARADNLYDVGNGGVRDWEPITSFATTIALNPYISEAWASNYSGIAKTNAVLDQLKARGSVISNASLRVRYEAEARFLRAFYYFDLVRWFGKVPLIDRSITVAEAYSFPRIPAAKIYEQVIADLNFATVNLPETYSGVNRGRATRYAAKALLALVYLTRSGPTYGIEGPGLSSNEYLKASDLLDEIILSGKYSLLTTVPAVFSYTNEYNAEVLFDVEYVSGGLGLGATYPGLLVPSDYLSAVNIPFPGGLEIRPVSQDLLNSYSSEDLRKPFTFQFGYTSKTGVVENRAFFRKYLSETGRGVDRFDWPINFIVIRYADILLMKAECIVHGVGGTPADADVLVNRIRTRAGISPVSGTTLESLMEERRREFAGEGLRWHDLVREGLALTVMNAYIPVEDVKQQIARNIDANQLIYPLPQSEITLGNGLYTQNPGY